MKAHEVVMSWVTEGLSSGRLHIGDHLPSERALAETLEVSRSSLREAMRVLEALGTIQTSTGSGPRSGTILTAAPEQALTLALSMQLATRHVDHDHILEARLLLESWAAMRSVTGAGDWAGASELLDRMDDPDLAVESFLTLDAEFHVTLSHSAGNPLISSLMDAMRLTLADHTVTLAKSLPDWETTAARLRTEHREILGSLQLGERDAAAQQLRAHIEGYFHETTR
ncbi:DNA-binding FadR family transcriptional regulator [Leucobacter exalbidus]|uniref:DNA-binding FadR family transcriptional regulator n=1 Tax=Leucobacter exalbidus TaxID=662960 RepID=A0A940PUP9_9MICO|nr:FCD domain-containing protein [Leucobacter exalbidus]MBP1325629.1 DNA-binding FadR family transcriptional regulator [Leucobacter exalbidus]